MNIRSKIFGERRSAEESPWSSGQEAQGRQGRHAEQHPGGPRGDPPRRHPRPGPPPAPGRAGDLDPRGHAHAVQLVNLSGGGAMVAGDFEPTAVGPGRASPRRERHGRMRGAVAQGRPDRPRIRPRDPARLLGRQAGRGAARSHRPQLSRPRVRGLGEAGQPAKLEHGEKRTDGRHPLIWSGTIHHDFQSSADPAAQHFRDRRDGRMQRAAPGRRRAVARAWRGRLDLRQRRLGRRGFGGPQIPAAVRPDPAGAPKPEVAPARWEAPSYLKAGTTADSPWADEWGRKSMSELKQELEGFWKR